MVGQPFSCGRLDERHKKQIYLSSQRDDWSSHLLLGNNFDLSFDIGSGGQHDTERWSLDTFVVQMSINA